MSSLDVASRCPNCSAPLSPNTLACPACHALIHAQDLDRLAAEATDLEAKAQPLAARDRWLKALQLLPQDSQQAEWITRRADDLLRRAPAAESPRPQSKWVKRLGPLGPVVVVLAKAKTLLLALFKLKFLLSLAAFIGIYWALWGPKFGIGFAVLILIHEMGHFIDVKRRGLPAEMPIFLPGLGAYVKWQAMGVSQETRAAVSLAGPLAGWLASMVCLVLLWKTGNKLWADLARAGAWLNVLNLIPVSILDGGSAASALSRTERLLLLTASLALWLLLGETVFLFVALGATYRVFTRDFPSQPSGRITAYYVAIIVCLGLVLHAVPGPALPVN